MSLLPSGMTFQPNPALKEPYSEHRKAMEEFRIKALIQREQEKGRSCMEVAKELFVDTLTAMKRQE